MASTAERDAMGTAGCPEMIDARTRHELIAQAAYFRAQHRGFAAGHESDDWCVAEAEVDAALGVRGKLATTDAVPASEIA